MDTNSNNEHFMYVVKCADGTLYTGYAIDVEERVNTHNAGNGAKYTRSRRPVTLIAKARFDTKHDAMRAEALFKRLSRTQKLEYLNCGKPLEQKLQDSFF